MTVVLQVLGATNTREQKMATYSYQSSRLTWLRYTPDDGCKSFDDSDVHRLIADWALTWYDNGGWVLRDFRIDGEPADLQVKVIKEDGYRWSFEMRVNGLLMALFDVSRADRPRRGRIRVRSAPHSAPYYLSESGRMLPGKKAS